MTEILRIIGDFLRDNATAGNLAAIGGVFGTLFLSWLQIKLKSKLTLAQSEITKKDGDIVELTNTLSQCMLLMGNMMTIAFGNSKLAPEVKIKLQENQDKIRDLLAGSKVEVNKETIEIKEETIVKEEMVETKSVLDQLKDNL